MVLRWLGILKNRHYKVSGPCWEKLIVNVTLVKIKELTFIATSRCSISESIPKNLASSNTPIRTKGCDFQDNSVFLGWGLNQGFNHTRQVLYPITELQPQPTTHLPPTEFFVLNAHNGIENQQATVESRQATNVYNVYTKY